MRPSRNLAVMFSAFAIIPFSPPVAGQVNPEPDVQPRPIAHWDFDNIRNGIAPDREGRFPGRLFPKQSPPETVVGISGKALRFVAGRQHGVEVRNARDMPIHEGITLMAWVWVDSDRNEGGDIIGGLKHPSGSGSAPVSGFRLYKSWRLNGVSFWLGQGRAEPLTCGSGRRPLRPMQDHWMHVAATYDGKVMRLYVNAVEKQSRVAEAAIRLADRPLVIGNHAGAKNAFPFQGLIDDVRIYNVALTQRRILRAASEAIRHHGNIHGNTDSH